MEIRDEFQLSRSRHVTRANTAISVLGVLVLLLPVMSNFTGNPSGIANCVLVGVLLIALAALGMRDPFGAATLNVLSLLLGLWVAASAFIFGYPLSALWVSLFSAALLVLLSAFSLSESAGLS
ncbi:MAG: hypothetical protein JSV66_17275 [Trueperaceae bacterium]|nr:MAG: hypothetical protein JSV66_17275 [Trueperaceae bacterium]